MQLAARDILCVKPVIGWWRARGTTEQCDREIRYALIATLSAPDIDIDLHTAISTMVRQEIDIEIPFEAGDDAE